MIVASLEAVPEESVGLAISQPGRTDLTLALFQAVRARLQPGRRFVVVTQDSFDSRDGEAQGFQAGVAAVSLARAVNFAVRHHIIWCYDGGESWLAGKGFPHGPAVNVNQNFSDIWVFQKPDTWTSHKSRYAALPEELLQYDVMDRAFFEAVVRRAVWFEQPLHAGDAGYPEAPLTLLSPLVRMWSRPGDTVLDVCPHTGQIGVASLQWKRNPILVAKNAPHADVLRLRLENNMVLAATSQLLNA